MSYRLRLHKDVEKQLRKIPPGPRARLVAVMRALGDAPRPAGCLQLDEELYRIRVGEYCIIYAVFDDEIVVFVCRVARRTEATYREIHTLLMRARREIQGD